MSIKDYLEARDDQARENGTDLNTQLSTEKFMDTLHRTNYVKSFTWMGQPIMQLPQDLMAMQEIICQVKPDYIIETGVAFGGMTLFYASVLEGLYHGEVFGIDLEVRPPNRQAIDRSFLRKRIRLFEGNSASPKMAEFIKSKWGIGWSTEEKVIVSLDSNHTHEHVLKELLLYSPLVSVGSYIVVFDTSIEWLPKKYIGDRPWGKGNSPWSAVQEFLKGNDQFVVDKDIENRILLTSAPGGWLRRIK
jgi:cephalosporin hydroxylase